MTTSLDIIKRHLCPEVPLELENVDGTKDIIMLKPLDTAQQALLFKINESINKDDSGKVSPELMIEVFDLYKGIVKKSIPDIDEETLDNFVVTNFVLLSDTLNKLVTTTEDSMKLDRISKKLEQRKGNIDEQKN